VSTGEAPALITTTCDDNTHPLITGLSMRACCYLVATRAKTQDLYEARGYHYFICRKKKVLLLENNYA